MSDENKEVVRRFNIEVIQNGSEVAFHALMSPDFINHAAPPGMPQGPESMWNTFEKVLRPALSNLKVVIHEQIAEADKVTTRKTISGIHSGTLLGVPATGRELTISVIDIVRIEGGRYAEHWGLNTLSNVIATLSKG
ncbi:ester cyclase [Agrobacterium sp. MS2]|uniref:ester cyclase n=1 Tax=Agrobacterium sp. MS2 TaxID=1345498 RepID=UPI000DB2FD4B|nr:ester cyclase [Agrobacterium sp. MS2]PZP56848.1 MAG: ester cyclase [Delftia acidovorans]RAL96922.1 ester cyclase [Agrobacterium sp. MS2]